MRMAAILKGLEYCCFDFTTYTSYTLHVNCQCDLNFEKEKMLTA